MLVREAPEKTLKDVAEEWNSDRSQSWGGPLRDLHVDLDSQTPTIKFGDTEVPATQNGITAVARLLDIPTKFIERITPEERQWIIETRQGKVEEININVRFVEQGVSEVWQAGKSRILPWEIVDQVIDRMPEESPVRDYWVLPDSLRIDTYVPLDYERFTGGDKKVGDITQGGVRVGQNRKDNLAPWVQPFLYRLFCTNGMETVDAGLKIDARGLDSFDVLGELGMNVQRALDRVEGDIRHFYDLRTQSVPKDVTGVMRRMAQEAGLPDRTVGALEDLLHAELVEDVEPTMFDLTNVMTNMANVLEPRSSGFRLLQQAGGGIINDHAARCNTCHQKVA